MQTSEERYRRDFAIWLRTGRRLKSAENRDTEFKFNPWHDPEDGRFTFSGAGRYYGRGSAKRSDRRTQSTPTITYAEDPSLPAISTRAEVEAWRAEELAKNGDKPGYREAIEVQYRRYLDELGYPPLVQNDALADRRKHGSKLGPVERQSTRVSAPERRSEYARGSAGGVPTTRSFSAGQGKPSISSSTGSGFRGGGGDFGGGGATGSWDPPPRQSDHSRVAPSGMAELPRDDLASSTPASAARVTNAAVEPRHTLVRNGYAYELDARGRTRRVSGTLSLTPLPQRSRTNQARAGGPDRQPKDDGGHYIAPRFNGPTDAFNHFAQDAHVNRGRYRVLEDQWAKAKRSGKDVTVAIAPHYREGSVRPFEIDVTFTIGGRKHSVKLPNELPENHHGRR